MRSIKAVFFDLGGTLFDYQTVAAADLESLVDALRRSGIEAGQEEVLRRYQEVKRRIYRQYLPRPYYLHRDFFLDALSGLLESFGSRLRSGDFDHYCRQLWERHERDLRVREGVAETLLTLKGRGLYLGVVSNIDEDQLSHLVRILQLAPYFDLLLSSERARSCKPDAGIFKTALDMARCRAESALFVGDSLDQDIDGANRAGMHSVLLWHRDDRRPPASKPRPRHLIRQIPDLLALV